MKDFLQANGLMNHATNFQCLHNTQRGFKPAQIDFLTVEDAIKNTMRTEQNNTTYEKDGTTHDIFARCAYGRCDQDTLKNVLNLLKEQDW